MMMGHFVHMMGFSLILSPNMYFTAFGFFFDSPAGEITPINPRVLVNQNLEMNCTVFEDSGLNASFLDWVIYNGTSASPDTVFINEERTLTFRKKIASIEEEGSYLCRRTDKSEPSIVKTVYLTIEYEAVRNVTNFTCILNEEKKEFHCRWELGLYNHPAYLNISIIMSPDNGSSVLPCPEKFTGKYQQNCSWAEKDGFTNAAIFSMSKIVILNVTNMEFNVVKSFRMEYITEDIKKPLPTEYINASSLGSCGCANVSWETIPGEVKTSSEVSLMSQWNSTPLIHNVDVNKSLIVCNLIPATTYTVEVKIKPLRGLYYSDPKQNNFDTCETVPSLAPSMQPSGYSSEICNSGNRSITVYWEKIPRKFQNGPLKEYRVSLGDENWKIVAPNATLGTIDIPCGGHNVSVQGCNRRGCSPDSSIYIPAYRDVVSPQKVIVEQMGLTKVQISWLGLEREAILANDVVWCKVKPAVLQCQGEIHILRRTGNMNHTVLHADTIDQALDDVIFGVAAINDKNVSSGIKWQEECRYVKDAVPPPVQTVPLLPDPPKNSLVVSWIPLKCDSGASNNAYIKMYQIIYCQLNTHGSCKGGEFSVNVPADSTTQYTLRNLEADTEYGVWVKAISLTKEGHKSEMLSGRPTNNDLTDASIAGIAIGGIFVLVLVIAGFVCVCRQVKRKLGLDETFDIENIQVRPLENRPTGSNLYNLITTPADRSRSSSPLITPNGTTSNGNIRHNGINHSYEEILPVGLTVDLDEEDGSGEQKDSKPDLKSNVVTLAITDVPRQISKDSGHGSLSPTSAHAPPTSEESDKKENFLRDIISDLPPDYAKATSVTTQCVHGFENGSYDTGDGFHPGSRGTFKDSLCSSSQSSSIPLEDGYKSHADFLQNNNDKQQFEESSKKCPEDNELERSRKEELENKEAEVEQTSGYVFYQPYGTEITLGNQTNSVQPKNSLPTCNISKIAAEQQPYNVQFTETTMGNQTNNVQPRNTLPTSNISKTTTEQQPYNVQFENTLPTSTQTISTNQPNSAKIKCSNISTVDQLNRDQSTKGPDIIHETDMCQTANQLSTPGYHPNKMLNTEHQTTDMDSRPQLLTAESKQFTDYLPHDTNFAELTAFQNDKENSLVSNYVVGNTTDLSVMNSVLHGINSNVAKTTSDRSDYVPKGILDYVPNDMLDYVPNGTSNPLPSGKTNHLPVGTSDYVPKDMNSFPSFVPDDTTDNISIDTKDYVPCSPTGYVPNGTTDYVPNGTTDYVPNGARNYVPNGTTDYVPNGATNYVPNGTTDYVLSGTTDYVPNGT